MNLSISPYLRNELAMHAKVDLDRAKRNLDFYATKRMDAVQVALWQGEIDAAQSRLAALSEGLVA